jgi:small subunit ribosomal protein S6
MTYNLTLILKPDLKEADRKKLVKDVESAFGKGKITEKDWGEKALAYPIEKQSSGFYVTVKAETEEVIAKDFEKGLYQNSKILRHLLLRED